MQMDITEKNLSSKTSLEPRPFSLFFVCMVRYIRVHIRLLCTIVSCMTVLSGKHARVHNTCCRRGKAISVSVQYSIVLRFFSFLMSKIKLWCKFWVH